jgi:hypothetical protein
MIIPIISLVRAKKSFGTPFAIIGDKDPGQVAHSKKGA